MQIFFPRTFRCYHHHLILWKWVLLSHSSWRCLRETMGFAKIEKFQNITARWRLSNQRFVLRSEWYLPSSGRIGCQVCKNNIKVPFKHFFSGYYSIKYSFWKNDLIFWLYWPFEYRKYGDLVSLAFWRIVFLFMFISGAHLEKMQIDFSELKIKLTMTYQLLLRQFSCRFSYFLSFSIIAYYLPFCVCGYLSISFI